MSYISGLSTPSPKVRGQTKNDDTRNPLFRSRVEYICTPVLLFKFFQFSFYLEILYIKIQRHLRSKLRSANISGRLYHIQKKKIS